MEGYVIETWKYAILAGIVILNFVFTLLLITNKSPIKGKQAKLGATSIVLVASLLGLISIFVMKDISPSVEVSSPAMSEDINPAIADGLKVVAKNKCNSCHIVNGEGTALGPDFELIAKNSDLVSVEEFLTSPKTVRPGTAMQNVNLEVEEVQKIVAMFKAMRGDTGSETAGDESDSDIGMTVFKSKCVSCHSFKGEGGNFGPDLTDVKSRRDEASAIAFIKDPTGGMPKVDLTEEELKGIVAMLMGTSNNSGGTAEASGKGLEIIKGKCQGCHTYQGSGGSMGPDLTDVKSRRDAASLTEFIKSPTGGMPPMGLSDEDLKAVVEELSGAAGGATANADQQGTATASGNAANGEAILKAKCTSCHSFKGTGGSFGPDLTDVGKRKDTKSLVEFIKNPTGGMPKLELKDSEIQDIVTLFTGGSNNKGTNTSSSGKKKGSSTGKDFSGAIKSIKEKCLSCHTVNGEGGKFGPELTDVANRLDKKGITDFIMNPTGGMPNLGIPIDEATKIADYFASLLNGGTTAATPPKSPPGINIYKQHACNACHNIGGKGGTFGPDLTQVGLRRDQDSLAKFLSNPPSKMTITPLTKEEIDALASYLSTLK